MFIYQMIHMGRLGKTKRSSQLFLDFHSLSTMGFLSTYLSMYSSWYRDGFCWQCLLLEHLSHPLSYKFLQAFMIAVWLSWNYYRIDFCQNTHKHWSIIVPRSCLPPTAQSDVKGEKTIAGDKGLIIWILWKLFFQAWGPHTADLWAIW